MSSHPSVFYSVHNKSPKGKRGLGNFIERVKNISITKRQRFVVVVLLLSAGVFTIEHFFTQSSIIFTLLLSFSTALLLFVANYKDIRSNFSWSLFILPFFYSLAFGLFYFLAPARLITRTLLTSLYAIGLYSLFLSQNIFTVASIRTIALLSGARIVSFVITLISFFFLTNVTFTFDIPMLPTALIVFIYSFFLIYQSFWTVTLDKSLISPHIVWIIILSLCLFEISLILTYWPSSPTVVALFLTGFLYTLVGPAQVWLDKRLFRGVMWEYIWVAVVVIFILIFFTAWRG